MSLQQFDERNAIHASARFDSTYTPPTINQPNINSTYPFRIDSLVAVSTDSINHTATIYAQDQFAFRILGIVTIPAGAGSPTTPIVDVLAALTTSDQKAFVMPANAPLGVSLDTAPSSGAEVILWFRGGSL